MTRNCLNYQTHVVPHLLQNNQLSFEEVPQIILSESGVEIADDYTKRKHVFRIKTEAGSEVLYQPESEATFQLWLNSLESVLGPQFNRARKLTTASTNNNRNRSPTGHSPATKSRKPSSGNFLLIDCNFVIDLAYFRTILHFSFS